MGIYDRDYYTDHAKARDAVRTTKPTARGFGRIVWQTIIYCLATFGAVQLVVKMLHLRL